MSLRRLLAACAAILASPVCAQVAINGIANQAVSVPPAAIAPTMQNVPTGTTATVAQGNTTVTWNSATAGTKTTTIPACVAPLSGQDITVVDEAGTASPINNILIAPVSGLIQNTVSDSIIVGGQSHTVECDGNTGNWFIK